MTANTNRAAAEMLELVVADTRVAFRAKVKKLYRPNRYKARDKMPSVRDRQARALVGSMKNFIMEQIDARVEGFTAEANALHATYMAHRDVIAEMVNSSFAKILAIRRNRIEEWKSHSSVRDLPPIEDKLLYTITPFFWPILIACSFSFAAAQIFDLFCDDDILHNVFGRYYFCGK